MTAHSAWWRVRRDELLALARERCPVCVYNEEIINEIFFDMLSVEAIDRLFYPVPIKGFEMDHDVFNLSKISEDQPMRFHFGGARGIQVTRKCRIISAHPVDIGDVLFITNTGATFPGPRHRDVSKRFLPEHYLRARKMCSVKI